MKSIFEIGLHFGYILSQLESFKIDPVEAYKPKVVTIQFHLTAIKVLLKELSYLAETLNDISQYLNELENRHGIKEKLETTYQAGGLISSIKNKMKKAISSRKTLKGKEVEDLFVKITVWSDRIGNISEK